MNGAIRQKRETPTLMLCDRRDSGELLRGREMIWKENLQLRAAHRHAAEALHLGADPGDFRLQLAVFAHRPNARERVVCSTITILQ